MATDSVGNSSNKEISFSEWQFVVKSNGEYSDDESIEIIEREILHSVTPSSCSDDERDESKVVDWEIPVKDEGIHDSNEESFVIPPLDVNSSQIDIDENTKNCSYVPDESQIPSTSIDNFSRKVLYSCVLAAVIGIAIHQYQGNISDILLNPVTHAKSQVIDHSLQSDGLYINSELEQQFEDNKIRSDDAVVQDLLDKREQFKKLCEKYEMIISNTFISKTNIYAIEMFVLQKILLIDFDLPSVDGLSSCEMNMISIEQSTLCLDSSGKVLLFMKKEMYNELMRIILNAMQFDETKLRRLLNNLIQIHLKSNHLEPLPFNHIESESFVENINDEKHRTEMNYQNIQRVTFGDDFSIKVDASVMDKVEMDSSIQDKSDTELKIQELFQEVRMLQKRINSRVENLHRPWTVCNDNKKDSCVVKSELMLESNDTLTSDFAKTNSTHSEEIKSSVSDFIYKVAPITDRWSLNIDSKTTAETDNCDKSNGEWLFKMAKGREKYRKRCREKNSKKKKNKSDHRTEHKFYKQYRAFISDYKKYSSHFKSKLKKFSDGMKRSYQKFISSDWKHYAKNVFQSFRF